MSRLKPNEVTSPLSLFPFIGVLLSTMGALLVVLIAVSRSAHDSALRTVATQKAAAVQSPQPSPESDENQRQLQEVDQYIARLNEVQQEGSRRLRDDQLKLSHAEAHMRELQEQLAALKAAAVELESMDKDHLDDRRQAQREVERLQDLIKDTQDTIKSLKDSTATKKRSYAIIPYDGPNGTRRRPIYIECHKEKVIIQPEGIEFSEQDFAPPTDAGNPLAAALRAINEQLVRESGGMARNKQTEPYPLILIRPDGIGAYYAARSAISGWESDFGYEFVGDDWKLEFQPPNPQLARLAQHAVEQARVRRRVLAAAAPRAFRGGGFGGGGGGGGSYSGGFEDDDDEGSPFSSGGSDRYSSSGNGSSVGGSGTAGGGRSTASGAGSPQNVYAFASGGGSGNANPSTGSAGNRYGENGNSTAGSTAGNASSPSAASAGTLAQGANQGNGVGTRGKGGPEAAGVSGRGGGGSGTGGGSGAGSSNPKTNGGPGGPLAEAPEGGGPYVPGGSLAGDGSPGRSGGASNGQAGPGTAQSGQIGVGQASSSPTGGPGEPGQSGQIGSSMGSSTPGVKPTQPHNMPDRITPQDVAQSKGSWAPGGKQGSAVPVRRSIQVIVRGDRLSLLPESGDQIAGHEIVLDGPMSRRSGDIVSAVQKHVNDWGMAGSGLYWKPVLVLNVGPDGAPRANELAELLKDSGIELRAAAVSQQMAPQLPTQR